MKKMYVRIAIFIIVLIYIFIAQRIGGNRQEEFFIRFDTTNINGKLEYAKIGYHGSVFKIEGIEKEFVFYPYTNELNDNKIFYNIAEKGDLIIKGVHSDILNVKKKRKFISTSFGNLSLSQFVTSLSETKKS